MGNSDHGTTYMRVGESNGNPKAGPCSSQCRDDGRRSVRRIALSPPLWMAFQFKQPAPSSLFRSAIYTRWFTRVQGHLRRT